MAKQNFIVDSLPNYVEQNRDPLLSRVLFPDGGTIARMAKQTGIKTSAAINYLNTDPVFQDGLGCGFNPLGTAELTQRLITTGLIKVNMDICPDTLLGKWPEYKVAIRATKDTLPFEEYLLRDITAGIAEKMEDAVWQGDTTSSNANLNRFDGMLKIAGAEADTIKVAIAAGTSAYDAIMAVYMQVPEVVLKNRCLIFVSPALFRQFTVELVAKNYFHYSGPQDQDATEFTLPGTNARVIMAAGLAGTANILASYKNNMYYGCDAVNDKEEIKLWFSDDDDLFKLKVKWNAGVQFAFPDRVVLGTLASAPTPQPETQAVKAQTSKA